MITKFEEIKYTDAHSLSETMMRRRLTVPFCQGNGIDIGSNGCPVVPWAIQIEKNKQNVPIPARHCINLDTCGSKLPFKNEVLDFVYSSHLLEDFSDWMPILTEWNRVLKVGGRIVIMVPDKVSFRKNVESGLNPDNLDHKHESFVGELTEFYRVNFTEFDPVLDYLTDSYNILFIAIKTSSIN